MISAQGAFLVANIAATRTVNATIFTSVCDLTEILKPRTLGLIRIMVNSLNVLMKLSEQSNFYCHQVG